MALLSFLSKKQNVNKGIINFVNSSFTTDIQNVSHGNLYVDCINSNLLFALFKVIMSNIETF